MTFCRIVCCVALAGALAERAAAQTPGEIAGIAVAADSTPVAGADVGLIGTSFATTTDASGQFRFRRIEPGAYRVRVSRLGYQTVVLPVSLHAGETASVRIALIPTA